MDAASCHPVCGGKLGASPPRPSTRSLDAKVNSDAGSNRPLTAHERELAAWLLEHGNGDAPQYLPQLELSEVTPYRCPCGCASINFKVEGLPAAAPVVHVLSDYVFNHDGIHCGIFIYSDGQTLGGIEVYGLGGDAPPRLPSPDELTPFGAPSDV